MNRYKLVKAEDGIIWVSLQPLQQDILESIDKLTKITNNDEEVQHGVDMKIYGLKSIYEFIGALITEKYLEQEKERYEAKH